ncbi:MAG TPA: RtcB family protein [Candidatus Xenobia bacterium]|jgi:tRNA-splicing ligase RtcB
MASVKIQRVSDYEWRIPKEDGMLVPGTVFASDALMESIRYDNSLAQVKNVAYLPGIIQHAIAMPDIHEGYGFPIGGVAAMRTDTGVVSPGGVGYDINCGVRLVSTALAYEDVKPRLKDLVAALYRAVPSGVGSKGGVGKLSQSDLLRVLKDGAGWAIAHGYGAQEDLQYSEERGCLKNADPELVSERALARGADQVGTLGSGNHFLELDRVAEIYDTTAAEALGLRQDGVVYAIHSGSRGLGHQVCDDFLRVMDRAMRKYDIHVPDRQLACAPIQSPEGQEYLAAMAAAANFAWANRQVMMANAADAIMQVMKLSPKALGRRLIYDVCHNIAKFEKHQVDGQKDVTVCVHRKGATRAYPPHHPLTPAAYQDIGQPVLIPGDMGRYSFVLVGSERAMQESFGSSCHGAGRVMSRSKAMKVGQGRHLRDELESAGIIVMAKDGRTLMEEMPDAYKDVNAVVDVMAGAGLSKKVAKLVPIGVVKG